MKAVIQVSAFDVKKALANKHQKDFFLTEVKSGSAWNGTDNRILDAVAMKKSYAKPLITGYEVKVTRSDFLQDNKFYTYLPLCHELYIVTPSKLVQREELPVEIGLIWYDPETKTLKTKKKPPPRNIEISVDMLQYIIYSRLDSDRIPFHSSKAEHLKAWIAGQEDNIALGIAVRNKMTAELSRLESELQTVERIKQRMEDTLEEYTVVKKVMLKNGWDGFSDPVYWLGQSLKQGYPPVLDNVMKDLQNAMSQLEGIKTTHCQT